MLVHTDVTSNWHILAATSYRMPSVLRTGTLWLDLNKYFSFLHILWISKCNIHSISEKNVLLNRIFHFSTIKGKAWSIYGGIWGVYLNIFVLSTWDKMARLGNIFINEILVNAQNEHRAVHLYSLILYKEKKEEDLTQSYDKSPYTNRNVKKAQWQHKQRHKKVRLHSGCGPT